jgi:hypothetical protein
MRSSAPRRELSNGTANGEMLTAPGWRTRRRHMSTAVAYVSERVTIRRPTAMPGASPGAITAGHCGIWE